ncbi:hypothetical protein Tsubulata_019617 [Turnera subulata]|uniref:Uncharacterized protein n=1 Tax=Turnera subulata TaxID=218843 RepID=A0A9Q0JB18_9ROSI|nr:hypothetical protein Tsubulata_019617 [Turnera subulata]
MYDCRRERGDLSFATLTCDGRPWRGRILKEQNIQGSDVTSLSRIEDFIKHRNSENDQRYNK